MRVLKPSWIHHDDNPIFSVDVHPDHSRVVTGGQGNDSVGRIVIWNLEPILKETEDPSVPKALCRLDHHSACVNCVRWSNSGDYLSSGGDDLVIIIWKLEHATSNRNFSSAFQNSAFGVPNLEDWKPLYRLRSHSGDILDLAWSPGDKYLASASVDNSVVIWNALNFPQIVTTITGHASLVKGVTWDPVGKYLASQSVDKTLKIWNVATWKLEHSIESPFKECGGTTHFLRLDWSPDASFVVSAHAMNGGGPTAKIIQRADWNSERDFVGHRRAVVCVRFNGQLMKGKATGEERSIVALGSRDRSISIWSTGLTRPLLVINDLFTSTVLDLSWSSCGTLLMACSNDGSVAVLKFSRKEMGIPLSPEEKTSYLQKHYGKSCVTSNDNNNHGIIQNLDVFLAKSKRPFSSEISQQPLPIQLPAHAPNKGVMQIQPRKVPRSSSAPVPVSHSSSTLPQVKSEVVSSFHVNLGSNRSYSLEVTNNNQRPDGQCHQVVCRHSVHSLDGLDWTFCTDAPICDLAGDQHRIVLICKNASVHLLDIKGRYAAPPIYLSGQPTKFLLSGPYLVIITADALIYVWNIHTKQTVLKAESLLPILEKGPLEIAKIQVNSAGLPILWLANGKNFTYSCDFGAWMLLSDPQGLVSSSLGYEQSGSSHMTLFTPGGRLKSKPGPSIISHIKLKLATCREVGNGEGVDQWTVALAKELAAQGLDQELHQLCLDILGPTHSSTQRDSAVFKKKKQLLRKILNLLLDDLRCQDLYTEFDEMLREMENSP